MNRPPGPYVALPNETSDPADNLDAEVLPSLVVAPLVPLEDVEVVPLVSVGATVVAGVVMRGEEVAVEVDVAVGLGLRMLVAVSHSPVTGSRIEHPGDRETWANEASVPPERKTRVIPSPRQDATETCIMARRKRPLFIGRPPPGWPDRLPPADPGSVVHCLGVG
jgi:hypothetical protein